MNGYVSTLGLQSIDVVEEICTLFLPLVQVPGEHMWKYEQNDPIAYQALLTYLHESKQTIQYDQMSAERLFAHGC